MTTDSPTSAEHAIIADLRAQINDLTAHISLRRPMLAYRIWWLIIVGFALSWGIFRPWLDAGVNIMYLFSVVSLTATLFLLGRDLFGPKWTKR